MTRLANWLGSVVACCLPTVVVAEVTSSALPGVVIHATAEPVLVGTEIIIDNQPIAAWWDQYFAQLFAILDHNNDGVLNRAEAARLPQPTSLLAEFRGDFDNVTADFAPLAEVDRLPTDGRISRDELAQYLRRAGVGAGEVRVVQSEQGLDVASARRLFDLLASSQGTWNGTSLADAYPRLRRFDVNDDQRLSFAELRLLAGQDRSSTREMTPIGPFTKSEAGAPPSIKLNIHLGRSRPASDGFDLSHSSALAGELWPQRVPGEFSDSLTCRVGTVRLGLHVVRGCGAQDFDSSRQSLFQQFETDDLDQNQILDEHEVQRSTSSNYFSMLMAVADRNTDRRLTTQELNRYLDLQASAATHCVVVTIADFGSSLTAVLDADGDAALSLRKLKHGWSQVAAWDRDGDQTLSWDEVPHEYQLTWSEGRPQAPAAIVPLPKKTSAAPLWFLRMDGNGDGDLSRREFLGTLPEFRRWDADGDGLVSPAEANAATKN